MATIVKGDLYERLDGKLHELKRQIRQPKGYPHDPEILDRALQTLIENPNRVFGNEYPFPVWKTVKLGTGLRTADDFRRALKDAGHRTSDWAEDILGKSAFTVVPKETEVELVRVTVAELGFARGATRADIYERALELGLELCPPEVGPQLRLQYKYQPMGEWLFIAMEPITDSDGDPSVFSFERVFGGSWLRTSCGRPTRVWGAGHVWVFLRRK